VNEFVAIPVLLEIEPEKSLFSVDADPERVFGLRFNRSDGACLVASANENKAASAASTRQRTNGQDAS
jgi:hypothetical protein